MANLSLDKEYEVGSNFKNVKLIKDIVDINSYCKGLDKKGIPYKKANTQSGYRVKVGCSLVIFDKQGLYVDVVTLPMKARLS